ncbi:MAG: HD domain-containing protein [Oceanicaulis sp.]
MSARARLVEQWALHAAEAGLDDPRSRIGRRVIAKYAAPWRRYHGLGHLAFLFGEIERLRGEIADRDRLRFAAWFHDAIYVSWRKDNEARSAAWAQRALAAMGASDRLQSKTAALIEATADHAGAALADLDDALFLDMDMAILGAPPESYDRYARQVRFEYAFAPGPLYRKGRSAFLKAQLARERIFHTAQYERERGDQARANMARELDRLSGVLRTP